MNKRSECLLCSQYVRKNNRCVTQCNHTFCLNCLLTFQSHYRTSKCPECNNELINSNNEDPETYIEKPFYETLEEETEKELDKLGCVDDIAKILEEKGVKMVDLLSYYDNRYNSKEPEYRNHRSDCNIYYMEYMIQSIEETFAEVDANALANYNSNEEI